MYGFDRGEGFETLTLEQRTGVDGQGKPAYGSPMDVEGRAVRETDVARTGTGSEVRTIATVWLVGTTTPLPVHEDRITLADGLTGIVVERVDGKTLGGVLDHIRLMLREE